MYILLPLEEEWDLGIPCPLLPPFSFIQPWSSKLNQNKGQTKTAYSKNQNQVHA